MKTIKREVIYNNSITKYGKKNSKYYRIKNTYKNRRFRQKAGMGDDDPKKTTKPPSFIEKRRIIRANNIEKVANNIEKVANEINTFYETNTRPTHFRPTHLTDDEIKTVVDYYKKKKKEEEEERAAAAQREEEERAAAAQRAEEERAAAAAQRAEEERAAAAKKEREERAAAAKKEREERAAAAKKEREERLPIAVVEKLIELFKLAQKVSISKSIHNLENILSSIIVMPEKESIQRRRDLRGTIMGNSEYVEGRLNELRKNGMKKIIEEIEKLLPKDLDEVDSNGLTLLDHAIRIGNVDIINLIRSRTRNKKIPEEEEIGREAHRQLEKRQKKASKKITRNLKILTARTRKRRHDNKPTHIGENLIISDNE